MRLPSGVSGFDEMVQGGLPEGASVVLQGPPGQEKLRFALTFLAEGLKTGASGLVVVASQSPDAILSELRGLGVDLDRVVRENRLRIVDWYTQREEPVQDVEERGIVLRSSIDLTNVGVALSRAIAALGGDRPKRAVVELMSPATSVYEVGQVYAFAQSSKGKFVRFNFTALYLLEKEMHTPADVSTLHQPFDGVIEIERVRVGDAIVRKIGVLHLKDTTSESEFRIVETAPDGLRVVREPSRPTAAPEPPSTIPPPIRAPPRTEASRRTPVTPGAKGSAKPPVFETKEESPTRAYLIMQIARERLKLNPGDSDALFAMAAAQATLDDARGAIDALERLAKIDDRYPGLWVLKTKLHARLGDVEKARQSRTRAEAAEEWEGEELMVPCPLCETPVAEGASRCSKCGATFLTDSKITDELDALGQAAIQEKVQEELGGGSLMHPPPERPAKLPQTSKPKSGLLRKVAALRITEKPVEKRAAKQGLTNGFVRERARPVGMTNGLRGRTNGLTNGVRGRTNGLTNGLRGRTNGLTNGLGRTNGLTNGLRGRTNGLTNGLGRTNGLTNGMGRTNGLTNGLVSLRRGITNGLTNGNGFTNGLGSPRFQREVRLNRWKLYVIPLLVVGLMALPLFMPTELADGLHPIRIDGDFSDWSQASPRVQSSSSAVNANADITRFGTFENGDRLAFFVEVRGAALVGGGAPPRYDILRIFLDTDGNAGTGYSVSGLGSDRLIEVSGWGNRVNATRLAEWDVNRSPGDWNGWIKTTSIPAATVGARLELDVPWDLLAPQKQPIGVFAHFQAHDGTFDMTDYAVGHLAPSLFVEVLPTVPSLISGSDVPFLQFDLTAYGGDVAYSGLTITALGTAPTSVSSVRLADALGTPIDERVPIGPQTSFQFPTRTVAAETSERLLVRGDPFGVTGETLGFTMERSTDMASANAFVTVQPRPGTQSVGYLGTIPSEHRIDSGFAEWSNISVDGVDSTRRPGVDLQGYTYERTAATAELFLSVSGRAFEGVVVPSENPIAYGASPSPGGADSDRDTVPDIDDPMPFDFNNDGINDVATGGDYDGDGVQDYPLGPDYYLNTTIPANFPPAYANRAVSLYIGPTIRPPLFGDDAARVFLDADSDPTTGFRVNVLGADLLIEFRGRAGVLTGRALSRFVGSSGLDWAWTPVLSVAAATDYSRVEASFPVAGLGFTNNSLAYFEVMDWALDKDASLDPILRVGALSSESSGPAYAPGSVHTMDLAGNEKWFFTNTNSAETVCTVNKVASTTAGASAATSTLSAGQSICWYSADGSPDTVAGTWEVILDIDKTTDGTQTFFPNANGDTNGWSATGCTEANEYECVDDDPNDGDTTYVSSIDSATLDSLFNIPDWGSPPSPFSATVSVEASCRKTGGAGVDARIIIKNGATTTVGSTAQNCANSATYSVWSETWATDPSDGAAWTAADINALQIGVRDNDATIRDVRVSHLKATVTFTPVYSVEINRCENAGCTTTTNLYPATNFNAYGGDVTIQTGSIAAQTLVGQVHVQWKITLVNGGTVTLRYNGANPGTDDSRATVAVPEFQEIAIPLAGTVLIVAAVQRWRIHRQRRGKRSLRS